MQRQQFADVEPGYDRANRLEFAAIFGRRLRLHIKCFQLAHPSLEPHQNHRGILRRLTRHRRLRPQPQQIAKTQPTHQQRTRLQEPSPRQSSRAKSSSCWHQVASSRPYKSTDGQKGILISGILFKFRLRFYSTNCRSAALFSPASRNEVCLLLATLVVCFSLAVAALAVER